jgi:hypothetical protein
MGHEADDFAESGATSVDVVVPAQSFARMESALVDPIVADAKTSSGEDLRAAAAVPEDPTEYLRGLLKIELAEGERPEPKCFQALAKVMGHFLARIPELAEEIKNDGYEGIKNPVTKAEEDFYRFMTDNLGQEGILAKFCNAQPPMTLNLSGIFKQVFEILAQRCLVNNQLTKTPNSEDLVKAVLTSVYYSSGQLQISELNGNVFVIPEAYDTSYRDESLERIKAYLRQTMGFGTIEYDPVEKCFIEETFVPPVEPSKIVSVSVRLPDKRDVGVDTRGKIRNEMEVLRQDVPRELTIDSRHFSTGPIITCSEEESLEEASASLRQRMGFATIEYDPVRRCFIEETFVPPVEPSEVVGVIVRLPNERGVEVDTSGTIRNEIEVLRQDVPRKLTIDSRPFLTGPIIVDGKGIKVGHPEDQLDAMSAVQVRGFTQKAFRSFGFQMSEGDFVKYKLRAQADPTEWAEFLVKFLGTNKSLKEICFEALERALIGMTPAEAKSAIDLLKECYFISGNVNPLDPRFVPAVKKLSSIGLIVVKEDSVALNGILSRRGFKGEKDRAFIAQEVLNVFERIQ